MKIEIAFSKTEGSKIYPTWKIISFMDAARRRETLGSDIKESLFLTAIAVAIYPHLCLFPEPCYSQGDAERVR